MSTTPAPSIRKAPRLGEFKGAVSLISVIPSSTKPAIFTRIDLPAVPAGEGRPEVPAEQVTHAVRMVNPQSIRIGLDEIRGAFTELVGKSDEEVLVALMSQTDSFVGRTVTVSIEPQLDKATRAPVRGTNGEAYYNVRLRSGLRNVEAATAKSIAAAMLAGHAAASHLDEAFDQE